MSSKIIYLTRHAYSCSNYNKDLVKLIKSHRHRDPSITMWGMFGSKLISEKEPFNNVPNELIVYVSCLVRTWQTAVMLYNKCTTLHIVVSPFAKEQDNISVINEDNKPHRVEIQCVYFLYFLTIVQHHISCKSITIYIGGKGKLEFILDGDWKLKTSMDTLYDYKDVKSKSSTKHNKLSKIRKCIDYIPHKVKPGQFEEYKQHLSENIEQCISKNGIHSIKESIQQPYISYTPDYYQSNPNQFISWLVTQPTVNNEYRCVLHSHIMANYLNTHFNIDRSHNPASDQNLWTLKLSLSNNYNITDASIYEGLPKPNPNMLVHQNELICNQNLGGKKNKTKKKKN